MSLPLANLDLNACICIRGDVLIHPTAAIAPGVILRAEPNSRILVASGVCIGMGSIIHAYQGDLELEEGVSLGTGVLIIGQGTIGAHACIGSNSTLFNHSVEPKQAIAANTLLGDPSRPVTLDVEATVSTGSTSQGNSQSASPSVATGTPTPPAATRVAGVTVFEISTATTPIAPPPEQPQTQPQQVSGQAYLNTLLDTLLPHRQVLNRTADNPPASTSS
jgi:carbon dioxide concentrating mechanism protein CcmN